MMGQRKKEEGYQQGGKMDIPVYSLQECLIHAD